MERVHSSEIYAQQTRFTRATACALVTEPLSTGSDSGAIELLILGAGGNSGNSQRPRRISAGRSSDSWMTTARNGVLVDGLRVLGPIAMASEPETHLYLHSGQLSTVRIAPVRCRRIESADAPMVNDSSPRLYHEGRAAMAAGSVVLPEVFVGARVAAPVSR
jgi:hypothetical protein